MRGIILAGGTGSRLHPVTAVTSKQMMPVYDKPLIYYPLSTLMLAGVTEVLVISSQEAISAIKGLLGSGNNFGIQITYQVQVSPEGIAQALVLGEEFIGEESVVLILGDNIFYGPGLGRQLMKCNSPKGAMIFGYEVPNPSEYGVAEVDGSGTVVSIVEKPVAPESNLAIPGIYFFDSTVAHRAKAIKKSKRGEYEITSVLNSYLVDDCLDLTKLNRGTVWMDCGTFDGLSDASNFVRIVQERQQQKISCPEEIAFVQGLMSKSQLDKHLSTKPQNEYYEYLRRMIKLG
jgi:glucose-1-phosphate thymidylyltransferase